MKKKLLPIGFSIASFLSLAQSAFAANVNPCPEEGGGGVNFNLLCNFNADSIGQYVGNIIIVILIIAAIIALVFLIVGGIRWVVSGGDKAKVESARNTIIAAIIGLIIVFISFFVIQIVFTLFGLGNIRNLETPKIFNNG